MVSQEIINFYLKEEGGEIVVSQIKRVEQAIKLLEKVFHETSLSVEKFEKRMKFLKNELNRLTAPAQKVVGANRKMADSTKKTEWQFKKLQRAVLMAGMSIMFMGLQIQRMFLNIARSSVDSFMKISAGITPAGQAITAFGAAFEYLKFTIGDAIGNALLPFLPTILEIVDEIGNWVEENQELTVGLIAAGVIMGSLMFIGGQLGMLFNGLAMLFKALTGASGMLAGGKGLGALAAILLKFVPIIAILALAWITNFNNIREEATKFVNFIGKTFERLVGNIFEIFEGMWEILIGLFEGESKKMWSGVVKISKGALKLLFNIVVFTIKAIIDVTFWIAKGFLDMFATVIEFGLPFGRKLIEIFLKPLDLFLSSINAVIRRANEIPGINIGYLPTFAEGIGKAYAGFGQKQIDEFRRVADAGYNKVKELQENALLGDNFEKAFYTIDKMVDSWVDKNFEVLLGKDFFNEAGMDDLKNNIEESFEPVEQSIDENTVELNRLNELLAMLNTFNSPGNETDFNLTFNFNGPIDTNDPVQQKDYVNSFIDHLENSMLQAGVNGR